MALDDLDLTPLSPTVCGILGLLLHDSTIDAASEICEGLALLQHRGQDACGIVTCGPKGRFYQCKANGMVRDVFDASAISRLIGGMGVGHGMSPLGHVCSSTQGFNERAVRYPTAGSSNHAEAQPFYVNSPYGIVMAHVSSLIPLPFSPFRRYLVSTPTFWNMPRKRVEYKTGEVLQLFAANAPHRIPVFTSWMDVHAKA